MNLKSLGANKTQVEFTNKEDQRVRVLFSYQTPVAAAILKADGQHFYKTEQYYSRTTSKHINSWMPADDAEAMPQEFFDELVA